MKFFNSTVERLERKINDLVAENHTLRYELAEVKESMQFHTDHFDTKLEEVKKMKETKENSGDV